MDKGFQYDLADDELTTRDYEELENFLLHESELKNPMNLDALDGFLTALLVGPESITPGEWLPYVWSPSGEPDSPRFHSPKQADRIMGLMMRLMHSILRQIEEYPEDYVPLPDTSTFENADIRRSAVRLWCLGFVQGMNVRPHSWKPLLKEELAIATMLVIMAIAGVLDEQITLDEEKVLDLWEAVPEIVLAIRGFWMPYRRRALRGEAQSAGLGRNDLCPCGSGKKYKKCCGK